MEGPDVTYEWGASAGTVIPTAGQKVVNYTAPSTPGQVIISVTAKRGSTSSTGSITCNVEATPTPSPTPTDTPTPTLTPIPTETPTPPPPTPVPEPIACLHPSVTGHVFPQLEGVTGQFPFYGPLGDQNFLCQGVYDIFQSEPLAVRIEYKNVDTNFGFWGIGTPNGYDATGFSEICFWAYAQTPFQAFRLKLKDTRGAERRVNISVKQAGLWTQFCTELREFSAQGVQLNRLENVNLGFDKDTLSTTVWVDDFEFKPWQP